MSLHAQFRARILSFSKVGLFLNILSMHASLTYNSPSKLVLNIFWGFGNVEVWLPTSTLCAHIHKFRSQKTWESSLLCLESMWVSFELVKWKSQMIHNGFLLDIYILNLDIHLGIRAHYRSRFTISLQLILVTWEKD